MSSVRHTSFIPCVVIKAVVEIRFPLAFRQQVWGPKPWVEIAFCLSIPLVEMWTFLWVPVVLWSLVCISCTNMIGVWITESSAQTQTALDRVHVYGLLVNLNLLHWRVQSVVHFSHPRWAGFQSSRSSFMKPHCTLVGHGQVSSLNQDVPACCTIVMNIISTSMKKPMSHIVLNRFYLVSPSHPK